MISVERTSIPGVALLRTKVFEDERGSFTKVFHAPSLDENGISEKFPESFVTVSRSRVVRGLHFQSPPSDHGKIVWCLSGKVLDVAVDLRKDSLTYGDHVGIEIDATGGVGVYISTGFAHGFCVLEAPAVLLYMTTHIYDPQRDMGVLWNSCSIDWPVSSPVISKRDSEFPAFVDFESPFS